MADDQQLGLDGLPVTTPRRERTTWFTPFEEALRKKTGTSPNRGQWMQALRIIRRDTGHQYDDEIIRRFLAFLAKTESRFVSPNYFRRIYHNCTPEGQHRLAVDERLDREHEARVKRNLAKPRQAADPTAIGDLVTDLQRRGRKVPGWLQEASERAEGGG
jgi:hypothetical protein